jgi:hypothetical protein
VACDLKPLGHNVVAVDVSPTMVDFAKAADLAIAFMSLQDVDDMPGAIHEAGRIVERGGAFCLSIVHPINSAGRFESLDADARFLIDNSYLEVHRYQHSIERDGLRMTFRGRGAHGTDRERRIGRRVPGSRPLATSSALSRSTSAQTLG